MSHRGFIRAGPAQITPEFIKSQMSIILPTTPDNVESIYQIKLNKKATKLIITIKGLRHGNPNPRVRRTQRVFYDEETNTWVMNLNGGEVLTTGFNPPNRVSRFSKCFHGKISRFWMFIFMITK